MKSKHLGLFIETNSSFECSDICIRHQNWWFDLVFGSDIFEVLKPVILMRRTSFRFNASSLSSARNDKKKKTQHNRTKSASNPSTLTPAKSLLILVKNAHKKKYNNNKMPNTRKDF